MYRLKSCSPLNIIDTFQSQFDQIYGTQAFQTAGPAFQNMHKLRQGLDFNLHDKLMVSDQSCALTLKQQIIEYLKYCQFLEQKFKMETHNQSFIQFPVEWSDSYEPKRTFKFPSMKYEICAMKYNLIICYFAYGQYKIQLDSLEERKQGTKELRQGLGLIEQLKTEVSILSPDIQKSNTDFSLQNLDIIEHLLYGEINANLYECMIKLYGQDPQKTQEFVSIASEAGKHYAISLQIINGILKEKTLAIPEQTLKLQKYFAYFNYVYYMSKAAQKMAAHHLNMFQLDQVKGDYGIALGYVRKIDQLINQAQQNSDVWNNIDPQKKEKLMDIYKANSQLQAELEYKNANIYRQKVPEGNSLAGFQIQNDKDKVGSLQNTDLTQPIQEVHLFDGFLSEEMVNLIGEIKQFAEQRKLECDNVLADLINTKNKSYQDSFVNYFIELSATNQKNQEMPGHLKQKIDHLRQIGGANALKQIVIQLKNSQQQSLQLIQVIKSKIKQEEDEDMLYRQQFGQKWNRALSSANTQEHTTKLSQYEDTLKIAMKTDSETEERLSQNEKYLNLLSLTDQQIMEQIPQQQQDNQLSNTQKPQLLQIKTKDQTLNQKIDYIKIQIGQLNTIVQQINFPQEVSKCLKDGLQKDKILTTILQAYGKQIEVINLLISETSTLISDICTIACDLNQKKQSTTQSAGIQAFEQMTTGFSNILAIQPGCENGKVFYLQLQSALLDIDKKVNDYLVARQLETQNLLQIITNQTNQTNQQNAFGQFQNYTYLPQQPIPQQQVPQQQQSQFQKMNYPNQQQFYQQGQFPMGQSSFQQNNQMNFK